MIPEGEFKEQGGPLKPRRPWWFTVLLIVLVLPALSTPWLLADAPEGTLLNGLLRWFPAYLLLSAICAWLAYPQRRDVAWVLVALMALSAGAVFMI